MPKGFRFRIRTLLVLVAIAALVLAVADWRSRRSRPRALRSADGPYLILARTFRGPDAEQDALALASELRADHGLPAYLFRIGPPRSNRVRPWPPGVAVLVGDARSLEEASRLLHRVKAIAPKALADQQGGPARLRRAFITQNPVLALDPRDRKTR